MINGVCGSLEFSNYVRWGLQRAVRGTGSGCGSKRTCAPWTENAMSCGAFSPCTRTHSGFSPAALATGGLHSTVPLLIGGSVGVGVWGSRPHLPSPKSPYSLQGVLGRESRALTPVLLSPTGARALQALAYNPNSLVLLRVSHSVVPRTFWPCPPNGALAWSPGPGLCGLRRYAESGCAGWGMEVSGEEGKSTISIGLLMFGFCARGRCLAQLQEDGLVLTLHVCMPLLCSLCARS